MPNRRCESRKDRKRTKENKNEFTFFAKCPIFEVKIRSKGEPVNISSSRGAMDAMGVAIGSPPSVGGDAVNQNGSGKSAAERERNSGAAAAATAALLGGLGFPLLPPTSMGGALGGGLPTPPRRHQVRH